MELKPEEFDELVRRAHRDLPEGFRNALENVAILVEEWPTAEDLEETGYGGEAEIFGLYRGIPLPERGAYQPLLPDTITIFKRPIEMACRTRDEVVEELTITLLHEIGHYLGMSEDDLDRLGYG